MRIRTILVALALILAAGNAHAQDPTLERVSNLIATGRLTEARNTLAQWEKTQGRPDGNATSDDRARALFLSGMLSTDAKAAEDAFIGVILSYPSSAVAPEALLRLGQGLYTAGETQRAISYLERLRDDYPASPHRETGMLWLVRAQIAAGSPALACGTARESLLGTANDNVRTLIELERDKACTESRGIAEYNSYTPARPPAQATPAAPAALNLPDLGIAIDPGLEQEPPARREPARNAPAETSSARPAPGGQAGDPAREGAREPVREPVRETAREPVAESAREPVRETSRDAATASRATLPEFAVQTAAFSERRSAETIVTEMRARGLDARIVIVPGSPYFRVRSGMFASSEGARAAALRIRDAGFATLIVNDVRLEREP